MRRPVGQRRKRHLHVPGYDLLCVSIYRNRRAIPPYLETDGPVTPRLQRNRLLPPPVKRSRRTDTLSCPGFDGQFIMSPLYLTSDP